MTFKFTKYLILLLLIFTSTLFSKDSFIAGKAIYTENIPLPQNATFKATLEDISLMDAPSIVLGSTTIEDCGQIPIFFKISFNDDDVKLGHRYAVRVQITKNDKLLYVSDTVNQVFAGNDDSNMTLVMIRVYKIPKSRTMEGMYKYTANESIFKDCVTGKYYPVLFDENNVELEDAYMKKTNGSSAYVKVEIEAKVVKRKKIDKSEEDVLEVVKFIGIKDKESCSEMQVDVPFSNNYWKLMLLHNKSVKVEKNHQEPHILIRKGLDGIGELKVVTSCNVFKGNYRVVNEEIKISIKDSSDRKKTCKDTDREEEFLDMLKDASYWKIEGENLKLFNNRDTIIGEFKAIFFN
ncbi:Lipoprotein-related protein [hydrothermal vent metagenome]|uniref:Lipoprotein-related protein n=1 Tax=hydrothermal vent metagenome TaxID=652676 RepID=A0A1W1EDG0_9ZZZZ